MFPVDRHEFVTLILGQYEDVPFGPDVHLCSRSFEAIRAVCPEHFDLQFIGVFADVTTGSSFAPEGVVALTAALPLAGRGRSLLQKVARPSR